MMIKTGKCEGIQTSWLCIRRREGKEFLELAKAAINAKDYTQKGGRKESQSMQPRDYER
jgi:hypothetical protein